MVRSSLQIQLPFTRSKILISSVFYCLFVILLSYVAVTRKYNIKFNGNDVRYLNELEYINGEVWANVWQVWLCVFRILFFRYMWHIYDSSIVWNSCNDLCCDDSIVKTQKETIWLAFCFLHSKQKCSYKLYYINTSSTGNHFWMALPLDINLSFKSFPLHMLVML